MKRPDSPEPDKPLAEMTAEELAEFRATLKREIREMQRPGRDRRLRQGRAKPRNRREAEIFAATLLKDKQDGTEG